jgi:hypothetical protein
MASDNAFRSDYVRSDEAAVAGLSVDSPRSGSSNRETSERSRVGPAVPSSVATGPGELAGPAKSAMRRNRRLASKRRPFRWARCWSH